MTILMTVSMVDVMVVMMMAIMEKKKKCEEDDDYVDESFKRLNLIHFTTTIIQIITTSRISFTIKVHDRFPDHKPSHLVTNARNRTRGRIHKRPEFKPAELTAQHNLDDTKIWKVSEIHCRHDLNT